MVTLAKHLNDSTCVARVTYKSKPQPIIFVSFDSPSNLPYGYAKPYEVFKISIKGFRLSRYISIFCKYIASYLETYVISQLCTYKNGWQSDTFHLYLCFIHVLYVQNKRYRCL